MLTFNPKKMLLLRGIERFTAFFVNLGMDYSTASRFLKSESQFVKIKDIEKLCIALNCTPNDLFDWKPDQNTILPENHSINALIKSESAVNLQQLVKEIPAERLSEIEGLLNELKK